MSTDLFKIMILAIDIIEFFVQTLHPTYPKICSINKAIPKRLRPAKWPQNRMPP